MEKFFRIELGLMVMAIMVLALYISDSGVTGFASTQVFQKKLDLSISRSESVLIKGISGPLTLKSFTLSGAVTGQGAVVAVLDNGIGGKRIVYTNMKLDNKPGLISTDESAYDAPVNIVTGVQLSGFPEKFGTAREGLFEECGEACSIEPAWSQNEYTLNVYVEPGTNVHLRKLMYTT